MTPDPYAREPMIAFPDRLRAMRLRVLSLGRVLNSECASFTWGSFTLWVLLAERLGYN